MSNATDEWLTPQWVLDALGGFDLDPCAHPSYRTRCAAKGFCLPSENGLMLPWNGRVWCNPPYGKELPKWIERMSLHNNGILLVPARTETRWFRVAWNTAAAILFPYSRISFLDGQLKEAQGSTFPSALVAFGKENAHALKVAKDSIDGALVWGVTP